MGRVTEVQLKQLQPYIAGQPRGRELPLHCVLHVDDRPSASLNLETGAYYCHSLCGGASIEHLMTFVDDWREPPGSSLHIDLNTWQKRVARSSELLNQCARQWHSGLMHSQRALAELRDRRGLEPRTARLARLGWNGIHFKIPVFGPDRQLWNIRTWDPHTHQNGGNGSRYWNTLGMGEMRLYPIGVLRQLRPGDSILFCEGEWDALLALQNGLPAITHTGGAGRGKWHRQWAPEFEGLDVYLVFDRDRAGDEAAETIGSRLAAEPTVRSVRRCELPFEWREKHGNDLSDLIRGSAQGTREVIRMMNEAVAV